MAEKAKTDQEGPFKEFVFEEWLRDGVNGIRGEWERNRPHVDTSEFFAHLRNAHREQLLAVRSLVDSALESLEKAEKKNKA
jgi:hypothetical protein